VLFYKTKNNILASEVRWLSGEVSKKSEKKKEFYTKDRASFFAHVVLNCDTVRTTTSVQTMTDSMELPVLKLPQIRPSSNNTIDTERPLSVKNGRKLNRIFLIIFSN
jgi:hypothetical protein